jgi:hypothetical protein
MPRVFRQSGHVVCYSPTWVVFLPNILVDAKHGLMWTLQLRLKRYGIHAFRSIVGDPDSDFTKKNFSRDPTYEVSFTTGYLLNYLIVKI